MTHWKCRLRGSKALRLCCPRVRTRTVGAASVIPAQDVAEQKVTDLLPDWAYFVRVVGNTDFLRPTAARDALFEDSLLNETRDALGREVRDWLAGLANRDPQRFQRFYQPAHYWTESTGSF